MDKMVRKNPFIPKQRTLVVLTMRDRKEAYFIDQVREGSITQETMLLGQFLHEFIECPELALKLAPGSTNRVYFPGDSRVKFYSQPTKKEIGEFVSHMETMEEYNPQYKELIEKILLDVDKQRSAPEESLEIEEVKLPKDNAIIKVTLSARGTNAYGYIKNAQEGQQELYYIKSLIPGPVEGTTKLLGQFLVEFEGCPENALKLTEDSANRIYFPYDRNVTKCEIPTEEETQEFITRMKTLGDDHPLYEEAVYKLLGSLQNQEFI